MMIWFGLTGGFIMLVVVILLAAPVKFRVVWNATERKIIFRYLGFGQTADLIEGLHTTDWLGLRLWQQPAGEPEKTPAKPKRKVKSKPKRKKQRFGVSPAALPKIFLTHRRTLFILLYRILRYLGRLLTSPRLELCRLKLVAGSSNPALTGMYYGWYQALRPAWRAEKIEVSWQPVFTHPEFDLSFDGRLFLRPWQPVRHTLRLILEVPKLALYRIFKDLRGKKEV